MLRVLEKRMRKKIMKFRGERNAMRTRACVCASERVCVRIKERERVEKVQRFFTLRFAIDVIDHNGKKCC